MASELKKFLDSKVEQYNRPEFIKDDPVSIPHLFTKKQDIEISAFFAAVFSWGRRTTIINKSLELMKGMDMSPYEFILQHSPRDLRRLQQFCHRTFNATDLLYFIEFLAFHYSTYCSLESAFFKKANLYGKRNSIIENALNDFYTYFFSLEDIPQRTRKHIASPMRHSSCKRLNMFLRWMVRDDLCGVDFGLWKSVSPGNLVCPVDLHVARVARRFGLLERKLVDWAAAVELTEQLRLLDPEDPVRYDFALFGLGIMEKF